MQALPQAAFLLLFEAAVGGTIALFWVHARGEVSRGFTLFTGICFLVCGGLAIWLRSVFPPLVSPEIDPSTALWFAVERTLSIAFVVLLAVYLIGFGGQSWRAVVRLIGPLVPLAATVMTWRTARIRSLDSATGLLYIVAALILAGEIAARTLFFLTGVAT